FREHANLALVDRRDRVHHDEEREQQRDQVTIRDGPRFVVDVVVVLFLAGHQCRKPCSFASMARGFSPSTMDTTPSITISRTCVCSATMPLSLPAIGRKNRFARPIP